MYIDSFSVILSLGSATLFLALYSAFLWRWQAGRRVRALERADLDRLSGPEFEALVGDLLTRRGYRVRHTGRSGDLGVDMIAERSPNRYAVQVKRQAQPVSRHAVSDAVAGKAHYGCNAAMVVTNATFSPGALALARSNGCELVDESVLADWLAQ